jgi:SAM-dependent methyltransferase
MSDYYWNRFYSTHDVAQQPSSFARFVCEQAGKAVVGGTVLDMGCGNGRDALFLAAPASRGGGGAAHVRGFDGSREALALAQQRARTEHVTNVDFRQRHIDKLNLSLAVPQYTLVYMRFLLHVLPEDHAHHALQWAAASLRPGGVLAIEARSARGLGTPDEREWIPVPGGAADGYVTPSGHYRRWIQMRALLEDLRELALTVVYQQEAKGLSPYGDEDPLLIRVLAQK